VGGVVAFDDGDYPAVRKVCRFVARNLNYTVVTPSDPRTNRPHIVHTSLRRLGRKIGRIGRVLRPELLHPDVELGTLGRMIAFRKERNDDRVARRIWNHWEEF
jgi:hypothetical protein